VVLVIGAVLLFQIVQHRRSGELAPEAAGVTAGAADSHDALEAQRLGLASELNDLESEYERGSLDEETYQSERAEIVAELREISLRLRGIEDPS
jgi:hypothetical protein